MYTADLRREQHAFEPGEGVGTAKGRQIVAEWGQSKGRDYSEAHSYLPV